MREFKIRGFSEKENKMYCTEELALVSPLTPFLLIKKGKIGMIPLKFNGAIGTEFDDELKLMYFTELEDSMGKEIYEGDILLNRNGQKGYVFYNLGCYKIKYANNTEEFLYEDVNDVVIVGNLFEDTELKKGLCL